MGKKIRLSDLQKTVWKNPECPKCGCKDFLTSYTRHTEHGTVRSKACRHCGRIIKTVEKMIT